MAEDISLSVPLPLEFKQKKQFNDLEAFLISQVRTHWGEVAVEYRTSLKFVEWFCVVCVSKTPKLDEFAQKEFIHKVATKVLALTPAEVARFKTDVDYMFEKGLVKSIPFLTRVLRLIFRIVA